MYNYFCAPTARYAQCLLINAANTDMQTPNKLRSTTPLRSGLSKTIIHTHTYTTNGTHEQYLCDCMEIANGRPIENRTQNTLTNAALAVDITHIIPI